MNCHAKENLEKCSCTYPGCSRKGKCCDCLTYHRNREELPGCYFPADAEATYNRSIEYFVRIKT